MQKNKKKTFLIASLLFTASFLMPMSGRIVLADNTPTFERRFGAEVGDNQFDSPTAIALDSSNNAYITDNGLGIVKKFDSTGTFLDQWGGPGSGDGQFNNPQGITVDTNGFVYVVDSNNNRIQKFDSSGNFVAKWGSSGSGDGQFNSPYGIAYRDSDGEIEIYVVDQGNNRIQIFSDDGEYLTAIGSFGFGDGQFNSPYGIAVVQSTGQFYVADGQNSRIQRFSSGSYAGQWAVPAPIGLAIGVAGEVHVVGLNGVYKYTNTGAFCAAADSCPFGSSGSGNGEFNGPTGVAYNTSTTNAYILDSGNERVQILDSQASSAFVYVSQWGEEAFSDDDQLDYPSYSVIDSEGNVYISSSEEGGYIKKFDSQGNFVTMWGDGDLSIFDMVIDSNDVIYTASGGDVETFNTEGVPGDTFGEFDDLEYIDISSENELYAYDDDTQEVTVFDLDGNELDSWSISSENMDNVTGLSISTDNRVFIVDGGSDLVFEYTTAGSLVTQWGEGGSEEGELGSITDIDIDQDNNLYLADTGNSRISKFDLGGNYVAQWGEEGSEDGQFLSEEGLYVSTDTEGSVYVAELENHRLQKFSYSSADSDSDGLSDVVEQAAPNSGDGNNDGQQDSGQGNVASFVNSQTNQYVTIVGPSGSSFTAVSSTAATNTSSTFHFGLIGFSLSGVSVGSSVPISLYFPSSLAPSTLEAKKFFPASSTYQSLPGQSIVSQTIGGQATIKLTYSITDGSSFDLDGSANGSITDPVGVTSNLVDTGDGMLLPIIASGSLFASAVVMGIHWGRKPKEDLY